MNLIQWKIKWCMIWGHRLKYLFYFVLFFQVEDSYMKAIDGLKTSLQSLDNLVSKQKPSNQVIQDLLRIGDNIQDLLQRINSNEEKL